MSVIDTLNAATPARQTIDLILDAALDAENDAAIARVEAAAIEDAKSGSLETGRPATEAALDAQDALRDRVAASKVTFAFERVEWTEKVALQAAHPPRPGSLVDTTRGYNIATYTPALIRKSCVSVTGADGTVETDIPDASWDHLLGAPKRISDDGKVIPAIKGALNTGQVDKLAAKANAVNDGLSTVPLSARSFLESQDSGASLEQPSPGTSPRAASAAGSRPTSPKSSGTKKKAPSRARSAGS